MVHTPSHDHFLRVIKLLGSLQSNLARQIEAISTRSERTDEESRATAQAMLRLIEEMRAALAQDS